VICVNAPGPFSLTSWDERQTECNEGQLWTSLLSLKIDLNSSSTCVNCNSRTGGPRLPRIGAPFKARSCRRAWKKRVTLEGDYQHLDFAAQVTDPVERTFLGQEVERLMRALQSEMGFKQGYRNPRRDRLVKLRPDKRSNLCRWKSAVTLKPRRPPRASGNVRQLHRGPVP
jgi:hypothetical protein